MLKQLRKALDARGLPPEASTAEAETFYARLSLEEKGKIGTELGREGFVMPGREPLMRREDPTELTTRSIQVRAQTANEQDHSIEATISTDGPVEVFDYMRGERIEEVLLGSGAELPDQCPLLETHSRWTLDSVLGSARNLRTDGGSVVGRLHFAKDDEVADRAWNKVSQGHLTDVSVGYRVTESVEIQPGQSATVAGRQYTATRLTLRIATKWAPREVSLVPIGADPAAKMREHSLLKGIMMPPKLRTYLETIGLRADASDVEAWAMYRGLADDPRTRADEAAGEPVTPPADPPPAPPPADPPTTPPPATPPAASREEPADPTAIARQAVADERERVRAVTELAGEDVPAEVRQRALTQGMSPDQAAPLFLGAVRTARQTPGGNGGVAIHSRSHDAQCNVRSLAAGLLIQNGLNPTKCREYNTELGREGVAFTEQDAEYGHDFMRLSAVDICREAVYVDTGRYIRDPDESIRAALSGGTLSWVFGTNIYAKLVEGWTTIGDSTEGWCDEEDVPNFLTQEEITMNADGTPEMHGRGDTATDATLGDKHETYRAYRFSKKATVDEQDIINDRLGAILGKLPGEMGMAFRRMRPNLVYSTLLNNPTLVADTTAVFHGDHTNLGTGALASGAMTTALTAMGSQRLPASENKSREILGIQARYLIVPSALQWTAAALLNTVALAKTHATESDPDYMPVNPVGPDILRQVIGDTLTLVSDDRIGAVGCWDPMSKAMVAGSATNWFLSAGPYRGVRVVYRRGTNRQPAVRNYALDRGQWGVGWDMNLDIGCKVLDYRGLYKSTGAG